MVKVKNDSDHLNKMLKYIDYINAYVKHIKDNRGVLKANDQNSDGVIYKFLQLKEEASAIIDELLIKYPMFNDNLKELSGFRNRLTHDYENVSYTFFTEIIEIDLPILKNMIIEILNDLT